MDTPETPLILSRLVDLCRPIIICLALSSALAFLFPSASATIILTCPGAIAIWLVVRWINRRNNPRRAKELPDISDPYTE
jgi:hypothetical protein